MGRRIALIQGHRPGGRARLGPAFLRNAREWEGDAPAEAIREAQRTIVWAEHLVIVFPLWLGDMPAVLKGCSARIVATMGMPAFFYRVYYRAHNCLKSLIGTIEGRGEAREARLTKMSVLDWQGG